MMRLSPRTMHFPATTLFRRAPAVARGAHPRLGVAAAADPPVAVHRAIPLAVLDRRAAAPLPPPPLGGVAAVDRKSTRLNSSHANLVCRLVLEKKKKSRSPRR